MKTVQLRKDLDHLVESSTLAINQHVSAMRKQGQEVFHFGFGESPFPVPTPVKAELIRHAHQKSYLPTKGLMAIREAISHFYQEQFGYQFSADNILLGPGSKELLFQLMFLLDGPLLLPAPSWVSYGPQAQLCGKKVEVIPARFEDRYLIQPEALDAVCKRLGPGQKILKMNSPNNPTGQCLDDKLAKALADVCRQHRIIVISDEIYALTQFDGPEFASLAQYYPEGTLVTAGLSKAFSAGGYRFGMALLPESMNDLRDALVKSISETYSTVSAPIQYAALEAYGDFGSVADHVQQCTAIHGLAGQFLYERFSEMGLRCLKPQGAFYLFPDFSPYADALKAKGIDNDKTLAFYLLDQYGIATLPGCDFNALSEDYCLRVASVDYDGEKALSLFQQGEVDPERLFPHMVKACHQLGRFIQSLS